MAEQAPYGSWRSPIGSDAVARDVGWPQSLVITDGDAVYWTEARPLEDGRDALVAWRDGARTDVIPADWSARTRVHEYGGGAYTAHAGTVYVCRDDDQRIYALRGSDPVPLTPEPDEPFGLCYADLQVTPDGRWLVCVRERAASPQHVNDLVAIATDGSFNVRVLASGRDFYSSPRISPDGERIAFLVWDHPRMPWEGCELHAGALFGETQRVAGGADEAIVQPAWSPSGELHHCSDRSGWWNLYRGETAVTTLEAEIGGPLWVFGESWYAFLADGRIVCTNFQAGRSHLAVIDGTTLRDVPVELTRIDDVTTDGDRVLFVGATAERSARVLRLELESGALEPLSDAAEEVIPPAYVSVARAIEYPTTGGATAHALFYPPANPDFAAPAGELPPLIVHVHGGPTAHVSANLRPAFQYFTSRGFAVVDVNYGGSTGYGREYRDRLRGTWGVVDVEDCVNAALHLAEAGEVDGARMTITGGSAGGWTVLCALALRPDVFACGADHFGVASLEGFLEETHKFESRYIDWLVPRELWVERSPITHADKIRAPVIVLQGLEDKVVPPSQSEVLVAALAKNGIQHTYIGFEGEQHGFRKAANLRRAIEEELAFYGDVMGFPVDR